MRIDKLQMSLADTYNGVCEMAEKDKPKFLALIEEQIDFGSLIPAEFIWAFHRLKNPLCGATRYSFSARTAKADLLFAGIAQLIGVVLAHAIHKPKLFKSVRKLIA